MSMMSPDHWPSTIITETTYTLGFDADTGKPRTWFAASVEVCREDGHTLARYTHPEWVGNLDDILTVFGYQDTGIGNAVTRYNESAEYDDASAEMYVNRRFTRA